jgi:hypothetical protein
MFLIRSKQRLPCPGGPVQRLGRASG